MRRHSQRAALFQFLRQIVDGQIQSIDKQLINFSGNLIILIHNRLLSEYGGLVFDRR